MIWFIKADDGSNEYLNRLFRWVTPSASLREMLESGSLLREREAINLLHPPSFVREVREDPARIDNRPWRLISPSANDL